MTGRTGTVITQQQADEAMQAANASHWSKAPDESSASVIGFAGADIAGWAGSGMSTGPVLPKGRLT